MGAMSAPMVLPLLKIAVGKARSFLGKYSAVTLMAQGKLPLSPKPSTMRQTMKNQALTEAMTAVLVPTALMRSSLPSSPSHADVATPQKACIQAPSDQMPMAHR